MHPEAYICIVLAQIGMHPEAYILMFVLAHRMIFIGPEAYIYIYILFLTL
jgi:hypothetical protein